MPSMTTERTSGQSAVGLPRRVRRVGEPGHRAVMAVGDRRLEPRRRVGDRVGRRHADRVEALGARERLDQRAQLLRRQKSSLA